MNFLNRMPSRNGALKSLLAGALITTAMALGGCSPTTTAMPDTTTHEAPPVGSGTATSSLTTPSPAQPVQAPTGTPTPGHQAPLPLPGVLDKYSNLDPGRIVPTQLLADALCTGSRWSREIPPF